MFSSRWTIPKCMNMLVSSRHHSPEVVSVPLLAP